LKNIFKDLEKYSENTAVFVGQKKKSYQDLLSFADALAIKVKKRSIVLVACKNSFPSLAGYVGFLRSGSVPLLVSNTIDHQLLTNIVETYQPAYLYIPTEIAILFQKYKTVFEHEDYVLIKNNLQSIYSINDDLALLLSTSGSTGSPKYVRQSYRNIESNTESIATYLEISEEDRAITTMPMNYTFGLSIINTHLFKGASIILTDGSLVNQNFWEVFKNNNATNLSGVPYIFEILKKLKFNKMELPSLKYITQAGGRLDRDLCTEFAHDCTQKGIKFYVMYGQVEATARISYLPWEQVQQKPDSIGISIPDGEIWLEDEHNKVIDKENLVGELVYQGENVSLGYAETCFDLQKGDENHGILYTGDLAKRDKDGFYYIVGRKNRFLKMFGNRINLDEIEQLIRSDGFECACTGTDDSIKIFITTPEEKNHIRSYISRKTGIHHSVFKIIDIGEIPRNETGKVLYSELDY
jgi:long-chain acyl-CoA synthetase